MPSVLTQPETGAPPSPAELTVLRNLTRKVAEIAAQPIQAERVRRWTAHNDLQPGRPLVLVFPEGAWRELLPDTELRCILPRARAIERDLRQRIYHAEVLQDENPI